MSRRFYVPPRGIAARFADWLAYPVMRFPFITDWGESPQLTHFWNNIRFAREKTDGLDPELMVKCMGDPDAIIRRRRWDVRFHLGGWSRYVVLEPYEWRDDWYVGWVTKSGAGVSQIPITRRVRMLVGPDDVAFFAVRSSDYRQIGLHEVGRGTLGDRGAFRLVPLH